MKILIDPGNYFLGNDNLGDRAIYEVIVTRLRSLWPGCSIRFLTHRSDMFVGQLAVLEPLVLTVPRIFLAKGVGGDCDAEREATRIQAAVTQADLVLATGGGYFCNDFASHALGVLDTLEAAVRVGKPAAILSCGFEAVSDPVLTSKLLSVLPRLSLIACRETKQSPSVLQSFGVARERIALAGDDAIELALALSTPQKPLGHALGVNLRAADYARVDAHTLATLREPLLAAAAALKVPVFPVPISLTGPSDLEAIDQLFGGTPWYRGERLHLQTPQDVVHQAAACRVVITGSYHAAVFALSQGVSVVALVTSSHYRAKMGGLQNQFGAGCHVVELNRSNTNALLLEAINTAWQQAEGLRLGLLQAAQRQAAACAEVYQQLKVIVECGSPKPCPLSLHLPRHISAPSLMNSSTKPLSSLSLSLEEVRTFHRQGYLGPFTAYEPEEMERIQAVLNQQVLPTPTPYCPFGLRVRHLDSRTVFDLCRTPAIVERMASIYGPDLILWNSNLFNKPPATPEHPEEYPWHQDHYNWNMEPVLNISAWLAITPATIENGCVELIPGSHRQIVPSVQDTDAGLSLRFGGVASDPTRIDTSGKVSMTLKAGQFFLFNERVLHHSSPNRSKAHRLGLAIRMTIPIASVSEPFPCILVHGRDEMGFNQLTDPPTGEPDEAWVNALPAGHCYEFDRVIPGKGWHLREHDGRQFFAWTGLEPQAWLDFRPVVVGDCVLRVEIAHMLSPDAPRTICLAVNGQPVNATARSIDGALLLEAPVSRSALDLLADRVRISVQGPTARRPCDINPNSMDKRSLGVGVRRVSLASV